MPGQPACQGARPHPSRHTTPAPGPELRAAAHWQRRPHWGPGTGSAGGQHEKMVQARGFRRGRLDQGECAGLKETFQEDLHHARLQAAQSAHENPPACKAEAFTHTGQTAPSIPLSSAPRRAASREWRRRRRRKCASPPNKKDIDSESLQLNSGGRGEDAQNRVLGLWSVLCRPGLKPRALQEALLCQQIWPLAHTEKAPVTPECHWPPSPAGAKVTLPRKARRRQRRKARSWPG